MNKSLQFSNVITEYMFRKFLQRKFMAFNPATSEYDDTYLSPNFSFFFARLARLAETTPAMLLGGVSDFGFNSAFDTSDTTSRGFDRRGVAGTKNEAVRTSWKGSIDFSTLEMVSVEAHDMLRAAHFSGEEVEIWEVKADKIAGIGILDNEGVQVVEGRFADTYFVVRVDEMDHSNNAGDENITNEWTGNLLMQPDYSWVDPFPVETGGLQKAKNRSLDVYDEATDIPENTQRDRVADTYSPASGNATQYVSSAVASSAITSSSAASSSVSTSSSSSASSTS